jgi:hypothetical protein
MTEIDFARILQEETQEYLNKLDGYMCHRFKAFKNMFNYFQLGETVIQIACGSIADDIYMTKDKIGKDGKLILIEQYPKFTYDKVINILGKGGLPDSEKHYVRTSKGQRQLKRLLAQANIEAYVTHLPPYPNQIPDESVDHIMGINCAFELMSHRQGEPDADVEGIITESYNKLKNGGDIIIQGLVDGDDDELNLYIYKAVKENNLNLEIDLDLPELDYNMPSSYAGSWLRWVKK